MDPITLEPLGDRAFLARFASERAAACWAEMVRDRQWPGVTDVVLAYRTVGVYADPDRVELSALESSLRTVTIEPSGSSHSGRSVGALDEAAADVFCPSGRGGASTPPDPPFLRGGRELPLTPPPWEGEGLSCQGDAGVSPTPGGKRLVIPVLYDGEDLEDVAVRLGLNVAEVIALHSGAEYDVFAIGFQPGFPYAGYLPPALSGLARRDTPRLRVPAGSVAIAGRQTGIYPAESPGGWHLLGRTPLCIVDLDQGYFPIRAGDRDPVPADRGRGIRGPTP